MSGNAGPKPSSEGVRILLVDDEVRNLEALECLLASDEYSLVRALSAEAALRELLGQDFAAILMDVRMPTMSGIELATLIKQRHRSQGIPIIFLTAAALDPAEVLRGYEAGAVDYLTKPIDATILKTKIAVFVDLYKKKHELMRAEESLRSANADLEARVLERTEKLTQLNREVVAASRAKDDFLAALSHELRTPLNPVLLIASDAAQDAELSAEVREKFVTIRTNIELEARLIDDLLDITGISHGKLLLNRRTHEIHAILKAALATVETEFLQKQIKLTLKLAAGEFKINADAIRLQQVFWNILKNAVKFTPVGGEVRIESAVSADGTKIRLRLTDTGIGLTREEIGLIFNAFSQGEHVTSGSGHRFGGLGLGLTISRMLMELHAGTIEASSPGRGQGATFTVEFPLLSADGKTTDETVAPTGGEPAQPVAAPAPGAGIRILLVEDHEPTRVALTKLLARRKHSVVSAISVHEARCIAGHEKLDFVISDIGLPDGDGYTLMSELQKKFGLKGIALTGYGMEQDVVRGRNAGFVGHLIKPVRIESLEEMLKAHS